MMTKTPGQRSQEQRPLEICGQDGFAVPTFRSSAVFATPRHQQLAASQYPGRVMARRFLIIE